MFKAESDRTLELQGRVTTLEGAMSDMKEEQTDLLNITKKLNDLAMDDA